MMDMRQAKIFTYWKRPWHKWLIITVAIAQLLCLWMNVQQYREISQAGILSPSEWESYAVQTLFQCALNGLAATGFLGIFLTGILAQNQKVARLAEGLLLLVLALILAVVGFALQLTSEGSIRIVWGLLLLLTLGGSVYTLLINRNR